MNAPQPSRRTFLAVLPPLMVGVLGGWPVIPRVDVRHRHVPATGPHPDPRPDVDASRILPPAEVPPDLASLYDGIREIPHVADGIRCSCGCADLEGFRSLLTCFEGNGMATHCEICQTEGRMVIRLHDAGRTLEQIRAALDARFG